jgi:hypothetical protein
MGGAPTKRRSATEKKAATLIWIGTAVFLIGIFAYTISDSRAPVSPGLEMPRETLARQ